MSENRILIKGTEDATGGMFFNVTVGIGSEEKTKVLSYEGLCKFLQNSYREAEVPSVAVGRVPTGYLDAKVASDGTGVVRVLMMGKRRPFYQYLVNRTVPKEWEIPYPSMIFEISYGPRRIPGGHAYCVKGTEEEIRNAYFSEKGVETFLYPFGNISSDGHMCMGNIHVEVPTLAEADLFLEAFWTGITNTDYLKGEKANVNVNLTQTELLMNCEKLGAFPEEMLIRSKYGNTSLKSF